jgi:hypothetical protein
MSDYALAGFLHVLCAIYWLGSDVAVYHISGLMIDRSQPITVRMMATKLMLALDMIPRTCLPITLLSGLWLAASMGLLPALEARSVIVVGLPLTLLWIGLIWRVHKLGALGAGYAQLDWIIRLLVIAFLSYALVRSALGSGPFGSELFLLIKLGCFIATVALGLIIRVQLKPLPPLVSAVAAGTATDAQEFAYAALLNRVKVSVWLIWALLWLAVWMGVSKPV